MSTLPRPTRLLLAGLGVLTAVAVTLALTSRTAGDGDDDGTLVDVENPEPPGDAAVYWTDERLRDAVPAPFPTVGD